MPIAAEKIDDVLSKTEKFVRDKLKDDATGHDWWHVHRVRTVARRLAEKEKADVFVVELTALLHDIADWKFNDGDLFECSRQARRFLEEVEVDETIIETVCRNIDRLSYKGAHVKDIPDTLEGKIVQDADRLDALGAIGIARTFAYGGNKNRSMHDPDEEPVLHDSFEAYRASNGSTINHFFEKLLLLKDRMNTRSAMEMARDRHAFLEEFLARFFAEWEGTR